MKLDYLKAERQRLRQAFQKDVENFTIDTIRILEQGNLASLEANERTQKLVEQKKKQHDVSMRLHTLKKAQQERIQRMEAERESKLEKERYLQEMRAEEERKLRELHQLKIDEFKREKEFAKETVEVKRREELKLQAEAKAAQIKVSALHAVLVSSFGALICPRKC